MLFRNRTFLLLMTGEVIAGAGMWISLIANLQFMQHLLSSDFLKSLVLMSGLVVSILLSPKAGVVIDRFDKGKVLFYSSLVRCLSPLLMFPALGHDSLAWMVASLVVMQVSAAFYFPAVQACLPAILPSSELLQANSIYLNIATLARIGGTAVGGVMVASMELGMLYSLSIVAYIILILITLFLKIPHNGQSAKGKQEKMEFREVFTLIKADTAVMVGLINMGLITLFLGGINLLVLEFSEVQKSPEVMGWIYTVEGTSILLGGLVAKRWIGGRNLVLASTWLVFLFAASEFGMSFAENLYLVLGSFALFGLTVSFFFPVTTTIFQKRLPEHTHGRFFSFRSMIDRTLFFIAIGTTGACLDLMGISGYLIAIGGFTLLSAVVTLIYGKKHDLDVRQSDDHLPVRSA